MTSKRRRRWESGRFFSSFNHRIPLWIVGVGLGSFLLGYLVVALVFFPSGSGAPVVTVPELRSLPLDQARQRLNALGLVTEVGDPLPNPEVEEGSVLAQAPLPGTEVRPGSPVRVLISAGRERYAVADVTSMRQQQAVRVLDALGFSVLVDEVPSRLAAGRVVSSDPPAGTMLPVPSTVRLTVSSGPPLAAVPDVVGMREDEARRTLDEVGFALGSVDREFRPSEDGHVIWQAPLPGDSLPLGEPVNLGVGTDEWIPREWQ